MKVLTLTQRQGQVLQYLYRFLLANHQLPQQAKIAQDFGWASPTAALDVMKRLERAGAIERNEVGNPKLTLAGIATATALEAAR